MKKNLVKKAVLPALIALICSVVALTSVSYAWFTMGNEAKVEGMQMNVTGAGGLQISLTGDASDFKSKLTLADFTNANIEITKSKVNPVSSVADVTKGSMTFYKGTIDNGELTEAEVTTADYICFDIYVKVNEKNTLYLDPTSVVEAVKLEGEDEIKQTNLASRVAFFKLGSAPIAADAKKIGKDTDALSGTAKIWEPNSRTRSTAFTNAGGEANGGKLNYQGIKGIKDGAPVFEENKDSNPKYYVNTFDFAAQDAKAEELCELTPGYNKIRVYIWLEGQDVDCLNEVSGGTFAIKLNFKQDDLSEKAKS